MIKLVLDHEYLVDGCNTVDEIINKMSPKMPIEHFKEPVQPLMELCISIVVILERHREK